MIADEKRKKVLIFGSTGSIGKSTLDVIRKGRDEFDVIGLCTYSNIKILNSQIKEFNPAYVCVVNESASRKLERGINRKVKLFKGEAGLKEFAGIASDISVMAVSGISCLMPLLINIKNTRRVVLANKETVVCAGAFVFQQAKKFNTEIIPADSEINALFQLFHADNREFKKVYITASGGALADYKQKDLKTVSVDKVLSHPNWRMGKRITVDSATLVNKAFEVIETHRFFNLGYDDIAVALHRESIVHALVEFKDSSMFSCMYLPDMRIPISFALVYPRRVDFSKRLNFKNKFSLSFELLNHDNYPLFKMILSAAKRNDNSLAVLNACDEVAIDYFLKEKIRFIDLYKVMEYIFTHYFSKKIEKIEDVFFWDNWARKKTEEYLNKL